MNPVLLATASALADATPENAAISAPVTAESGTSFSLPPSGFNAMAERLQGAKANQQHAAAAERLRDNTDPAAMQALMAMLLAQPTQPAVATGLQNPPEGEMLKLLAATQPGSAASPLLRQLVSAMEKDGKTAATPQQDATNTASLPPKLHALLAALTQNLTQDAPQASPEQQAKLTTFATQDLRVISPQQPSHAPSQQIAARVKPAEHAVEPRPLIVKKEGISSANAPVTTQALLNVAAQNNQPANAIADRTVISAHSVVPAGLSTDELGEKLTALLKDRIQFQLGQQQQISTIRLDPPSLGKLEIAVQLDAGKLMVHIGANQSDVCRSLQQFSENLRQHLTAQNFMEVNVQVSSEGQSQQQQQQSGHQKDEVMSALTLNDEPQYQQNESVLIKV